MASGQTYDLYFINDSAAGGIACVYQDPANAACNRAGRQTLAWMACGAGPGVQIDFQWQTGYDFAWFNRAAPATQQFKDAAAGAVAFSFTQYGYQFQPGTPPAPGSLAIQADASIPSVNQAVAGLGMSGAGTCAFPAQPNSNYLFTPVADADLLYWVAFGGNFKVNAPIDLASLPYQPVQLAYPVGVYAMTVTLTATNTLVPSTGAPPAEPGTIRVVKRPTIFYRAGCAPILSDP